MPTRGARILPRVNHASRSSAISALALGLCLSRPALAHVGLDTPAPDTLATTGQTVTITWTDLIVHEGEQLGYDLDLLPNLDVTDGDPIAHGLSLSTHRFDWVIPSDISCSGCYLRVTQVNTGHSYTDAVRITLNAAPPTDPPPDVAAAGASTMSSASGAPSAGGAPSSLGGAPNSAGDPASIAATAGAPEGGSFSGHHFGQLSAGAASGGATGQASTADPAPGSRAGASARGGQAASDLGSNAAAGAPDDGASSSDPALTGATDPTSEAGSADVIASEINVGGCQLTAPARRNEGLVSLTGLGLLAAALRRRRSANVQR